LRAFFSTEKSYWNFNLSQWCHNGEESKKHIALNMHEMERNKTLQPKRGSGTRLTEFEEIFSGFETFQQYD
jgi:hypothetical protein